MGKAREVPMAIRKAIEQAKKNMSQAQFQGETIPHQVVGRYGSGQVLLKPAPEGTGVIAGGPVRAVMEVVGIQNVLTKSIGTSNPHNVVKATFHALLQLKDAGQGGRNSRQGRGGMEAEEQASKAKLRKTKARERSEIRWEVSDIGCPRRHARNDSRPGAAPHQSTG